MTTHQRAPAPAWRKSSYSAQNGGCVEVCDLGATVAMRNSNHRDRGMLRFPREVVAAFVADCAVGEYDDLG